MGKQSKPKQSTPKFTQDERAKKCEQTVREMCAQMGCVPVFAQRTIDGKFHPLQNTDIVLLFIPSENVKKA